MKIGTSRAGLKNVLGGTDRTDTDVGSACGYRRERSTPGTAGRPEEEVPDVDLRDAFGDGTDLLDQVMALIRRDGLMDLIGGLNQVGADDQTTSWMGPGSNEPVSADRVRDALGPTRSQEIATALGVSTDDVAAGMARLLPLVVDRLTPDGTYPDDERIDSTDLSDIDLVALLGPG